VAFHNHGDFTISTLWPLIASESNMSMSQTVSTASETPLKRRRASGADMTQNMSAQGSNSAHPHIPKRGARACTACRKGKNRCEGEGEVSTPTPTIALIIDFWAVHPPGPALFKAPCRRCQISGTPCVFEKPEKTNSQLMSSASVEYVPALILLYSSPV
jgi:hypothetical protein